MALSASALSAALRAAMIADPRVGAIDDTVKPEPEKGLTALCDCIATAVVAHLQAAAVVTFPPGAIVVAGSAATQTNAAPCTGGAVA